MTHERPSGAFPGTDPNPAFLAAIPAQFAYLARSIFTLRDGPREPARAPRIDINARGQRIQETDDRGATRRWQYDLAGNLVADQDRDGHVQHYTVASWNLRGSRANEVGQAVQYKYDSLAEIVEVIDPVGNVTRYDHDERQRLTRVHRHGRVREEYVYDVGSHFIEKRDGDGNVLFTNEPHANHFVAKRTLASGGFHQFDYDERGRVTEASTQDHEVKLSYIREPWPISDLRDGKGVQHLRFPEEDRSLVLGKFRQLRAFDSKNSSLFDPAGKKTSVSFHQGLVRRSCPNGTTEILQYDPEGRLLARLVHKAARAHKYSAGAQQSDSWATRYSYTPAGDLVRVDDTIRGTTQFEIDSAHRLAAEITPQQERLVYWQDVADNVASKPGLSGLRFNPGNLLAESFDEHFEHDARDHLALRKHQDGSEVRYVYDSFDMLVAVERKAADGAVSDWQASYDAIGRRIKASFAGKTREFFWDYERLAAEVQPDGRLRVYQYASRTARVPVGFTEYENAEADPDSGQSYVVFSDPVGMPLCIEDQDGKVVWWAERVDPYGAIQVAAGATLEYNLRWPGHYFDPETGLHYNRFRYYDPGLARYLQSDPIGYGGSPVNLYAYCANPLVNVDLLGLNGGGCESDHGDSCSKDKDGQEQKPKTDDDAEERPRRQLSAEEEARIRADLDAKAKAIIDEMNAAWARGEDTVPADRLPPGVEAPRPLNTRPVNDPKKGRGPCLSLTQDLDTGKIYVTQNQTGKPDPAHPLVQQRIDQRVASNQENFNYTNSDWKDEGRTRSGRPGTHSEVHGANEALNDRAARNEAGDHPPGQPYDESDMNRLVIHNTRTEQGPNEGDPMPRCHNCAPITDGAHALND
ncbi:MAG: RHS repeat-associated core domain-containing protein [Polyangiaceae bacterium]